MQLIKNPVNGVSSVICNGTYLEGMVAGASEDTGLADERSRLAFPSEKVADHRDAMGSRTTSHLRSRNKATVGFGTGVRQHHHSQQISVESPVRGEKPFNLPWKASLQGHGVEQDEASRGRGFLPPWSRCCCCLRLRFVSNRQHPADGQ